MPRGSGRIGAAVGPGRVEARREGHRGPSRFPRSGLGMLLVLLLAACDGIAPRPIHFGSEECAHCRMMISDERFAAQLLTTRGLAHSFDAIECLAGFVERGGVAADEVHSIWALDSRQPDSWVAIDDAVFLRSDAVRSPMGAGLIAFADAGAARRAQDELGGEVLRWREVLQAVRDGTLQDGHAHH
jgi:copper chaperone NosL